MKTVYIAHPLMGTTDKAKALGYGNPEANVERYLRFCAWASNNGYAVISWVHHYLMHTMGLTRGGAEFYLSRDFRLMDGADELWVAGNPEASSGTVDEIQYGEDNGIPIISQDEWMDFAWMPDPESPLPGGLHTIKTA